MKISTKGDYATRALQELALNYNRGPLQIEEIAARQGVPIRYLEQLLLILKRAGFLQSKRGAKGGYFLAKPPNQITVGEIIRAMDGPIAPIFCVSETTREQCSKEPLCSLRDVWEDVRRAISEVVDRTTLEDICRRRREKGETQALTYRI
ncbi:MAG: Rrf2 family transcriptional regulator [candidate division NC10 bacterium]|nr:Rrf2 family transcriptional regulator [candidate division NC10 bacterium]